jgi:hypothetical protein
VALEPQLAHRAQIARPARRRARALAAVDVDDPLVPKLHQVPHGEARAERLVVQHAVEASVAQRAADHHGRSGAQRRGHRAGSHAWAEQDEAVGAVLEHGLEHRPLAPLESAPGREQQPIAVLRRLLLDPVDDLGEERVVEVVDEHPYGMRAPAREAARHRVGAVAERRGRREHPLAALGTDLRAVAHHQ